MRPQSTNMNIEATDMLRALYNTGISVFVYYPQERKIVIPENLCEPFHCATVYTDMPYSFAEECVFAEDQKQFIEMYERINRGEPSATAHLRNKSQTAFLKDTLTTITRDEYGNPLMVFGVVEEVEDSYKNAQLTEYLQRRLAENHVNQEMNEVTKTIAASISDQYYAIYHIWMETHTYICFHEKLDGILSEIGERGVYEPAWKIYIDKYIEPEYQEDVRKFSEFSTLAERLRYNHSISHVYRRIGAGWTRGTFVAGKRDDAGNVTHVIYSVVDINVETEMEEKQKRAIYESEHDSLTKIYNRNGLESIFASERLKLDNVGFAIIDIDHFKAINDNFGHAFGDQVLIAVAEQLTSVFYQNDIIARIGGDEFAILFQNCTAEAWERICMKFRAVHDNLLGYFPKSLNLRVTLSVGLCFSETGLLSSMYQLADEGLYETKRLGRSGCTLIGLDHQVLKHWRDEGKTDGNVPSNDVNHLAEVPFSQKHNHWVQVLYAMNDTFAVAYYLDLEKDCAETFKASLMPNDLSRNSQTLSEFLTEFLFDRVDSRDREIMTRFMDFSTLKERLRDSNFLDAEYRSLVLGCWCRARLLPVKYDEQEQISQILFAVTALDTGKFKEIYTLDYSRRSLASLFDHLPCGIVMYEWDGHSLEAVHVSRYYKANFGRRFIKIDEDNKRRPDFEYVHPEDVKGYQQAIANVLKEQRVLYYEYRIWNHRLNDYVWERVDAIASAPKNNVQLIYAVYTDITQQKEQALRLEKSHASLLAALNASNQLCYEYNPVNHTGECMTEDNFFGLPKFIENYPESLKDMDLFHPEDIDTFIQTAHQIDAGKEKAECDVRIKKDGQYCWYSCTFNGYYDSEKSQQLAILTVVDISLRISTLQTYENRLQSLTAITENTLCMSMLNLTQNTYEVIACQSVLKRFRQNSLIMEDFLMAIVPYIVGEEKQNKYKTLFSREYLLAQMAAGNSHVQLGFLLKITDSHYEWILSAVDMVQNPITGEITGIAYRKSLQEEKMNQMLLKKMLEQDYMCVALIFVDTDEFYLYSNQKPNCVQNMQDFWEVALKDSEKYCSERAQKELKSIFVKQNVINHLNRHEEYSYSYDSFIAGQQHRMKVRFTYADDSRTMILASMRNITDVALLEKYRHDSEHDLLTGLYNRQTLFQKCRELLTEHPDDLFAMVHVDLKHFRLYNAFFGDEAGDELLCEIANQLRLMEADYDYWAYGRIEADVFAAFFPYEQEIYQKHLINLLQNLKNYRQDFMVEPVVGLYFVTERDMSIEAMFTRATMAAKTVQPNTPYSTVVFDASMERTLKENQQILNEMKTAIKEEQFHVYLQPKYSLQTNKPVGAEALVRWFHPTKGLILPGRFIPLFERNGFISALDRYMWEHVCQLLSKWKQEGLPIFPISVNVSRINVYSQDTVVFLKGLVEKYDVNPQYLELELTESAYVESPDEIRPRLAELQQYGFKILMDDFGSGYSSLNILQDLPVDTLKLDMKFLSSKDNVRGSKVLSSVVRMSKLLNLDVIAEGVENEQQAVYLRSMGCDYVQGFFFSRPLPVFEYEDAILKSSVVVQDADRQEKTRYSHIFDMLVDSSSVAQMIGDLLPNPVILLEYRDHEVYCLRANKAFVNDFGFQGDSKQFVGQLFKNHLSEADHDRMLRAFPKCVETQKNISFRVNWHNDDGTERKYIINASYGGFIGVEHVFVVSFVDEEPQNYFE